MILLLGANGYVGSAFAKELSTRGYPFREIRRIDSDCRRFEVLRAILHETKPEFLINCAGYSGRPNVDSCELAKAETLQANVLLPQTIAHVCAIEGVPWARVSSGCIYSGAKLLLPDGSITTEKNLNSPVLRDRIESQPNLVRGFNEGDPPNFCFRDGPCSFYSGTMALAEEAIVGIGTGYVWRLRIPFDHLDGPRNYLSKLQRYAKAYDCFNSISHRGDFVRACIDLWELRAPPGVYNMTNPGWVSTRRVVNRIAKVLNTGREFEFWENDDEFYRHGAKTPRSSCVLDCSKVLSVGVKLRPVEEALEESLGMWVWE